MAQCQHHASSRAKTLTGSVEHVTFHSDNTGFSVLWIKANGHRDRVTVVGPMAVQRGDSRKLVTTLKDRLIKAGGMHESVVTRL